MAKGATKTSASSATRKKHARKATKDALPSDTPSLPKEKKPKGKDKGKGKEPPRKKAYIPPVKPQPVQQDPIDALGLAQRLPAELLVVWRGLSKKDALTKSKALEELRAGWIDRIHVVLGDDDGQGDAEGFAWLEALVLSLPVWVRTSGMCSIFATSRFSSGCVEILKLTSWGFWQMHHVPALFLHPSRRLRALALAVHEELLRAEPLRAQMIFYLREIASAEQVESILGSWCMATHDQDRHVAPVAQSSWDAHVSFAPAEADAIADASSVAPTAGKDEGGGEKLVLDGAQMAALFVFVQRALLDPLALHAYLNPVQVPVDVSVPRTVRGKPVLTVSAAAAAPTRRADAESMARAKGEGEEESETNRRARLRIGALGALQWILGTHTRYTPCLWTTFLRSYARYSLSETRTQVTR